MRTDFHRILIIKPSSLGDVVHALPTLAALRERFPRAYIAWLVKRQWAGLLERAEGLDAVWPVDPGVTGWLSQVPRLRAAGFDLAIDLQGLFRSGVMGWLAGCPTRIGFANAREGGAFFYTRRVPVPTPDMHAVERYLLVAAALGVAASDRRAPEFRLGAWPADCEEVSGLLRGHGLDPNVPWIAMNASARWPTKRWPPEFFAATADQLQQQGLGPVALIGGPDDRAAALRVKTLMRTAARDLTGETTPGLLPALFRSAALLVTNDSGPMHVAAAVGTPVVAMFGPTSPVRTGPYGQGHRVLRTPIPCSPCFSRVCRNRVEMECLTSLTPDKVIEAVCDQLKRGNGSLVSNFYTGIPLPRYLGGNQPLSMKILLVRPDGIGDEILCLPVASALRRLMPAARIGFLSSDYAAPVLDHHPDVDEVLTVHGRERLGELVALFRRGFETVIFLKPFRRLMLAAFLARVRMRVATGYRLYSVLANRRVYQHRHDFSKHESEYNLGLLAGLGLDPGQPVRPALVLTEPERRWARARLESLPPTRVVVHPGGFAARRWRAPHYWDLARRLAAEGFGVILTGSRAEHEQILREVDEAGTPGEGMLDLMGRLTVRELMAVIGASHAVVSGATGPAHLGAALGAATISLFDPRRNNLPVRWRPLGKGIVLRPDVPTCEKCIYEACPYWDCLDRITVDQVVSQVRQAVGRAEPVTVLHV